MNPLDEIGRALRPATWVAAAALASLFLYLATVEALKATLEPFRGFASVGDTQPLRYAFYGAGAAAVLLILLLRPRLFNRRAGEDAATALLRLQRASFLTVVLGEVPALLGLVLFLIGGGAADFYRLLAVSLVLVFIHFPRRVAWEEWLKG
ncbi:MAG TPA: hypothetical protein PLP83_11460 [Candidatus Aminicenantes bacterium]|nr:hypothetical protein [Candidatus Aminicenantes bacterium]